MKVKNLLLFNYILVFIITTGIALMAVFTLGIISSDIEDSLVKNRYTAAGLMKDDIEDIEYDGVLQNHGGIQVVDRNCRLVFSKGLNNFPKNRLTVSEFTEFLLQSQSVNRKFSYSIAYNENKDFWLIITFPTSLRIDLKVTRNNLYYSSDTGVVTRGIVLVITVYLILLIISTLIYSRLTAAVFTGPLGTLIQSAGQLSRGDYSARVSLKAGKEFGDLEHSFNEMADRIQNEIRLREQSENMRRQLTIDIAHDLKNPLAIIMGYAEYCLNNPGQNNEAYLNLIFQYVSSANKLINGLFELSRLESPEYRLNLRQYDFAEYIRQKCAALIRTCDAAGFRYDFDIPDHDIMMRFDPKEMDRVLDNITGNSVRYNEKGTELSLSLKDMGNSVQVTVSDDGKGIPAAYAHNIFKPFVRTDDARNSETGGSGLGLAIAERIVKLHGGGILLDTDRKKGCSFIINLPKEEAI